MKIVKYPYIQLSEEERNQLKRFKNSPYVPSGIAKRSRLILLLEKGLSISSASKIAGLSRTAAHKWLKRLKENGFSGLEPYQRIYNRKEDDKSIKEKILTILHTPPKEFGINRTSWKIRDLKQCLQKNGILVSMSLISKVLKKSGYRWLKARKVLTSNDPEYKEKLNEIKNVLSKLRTDEKFFSIDEFGPIAIKKHRGRRLVGPEEYNLIPQFQKSEGRLIITAALELSSNQISFFYSDHKNTKEIIKLIYLLLKKYKNNRQLFLSWDAAAWHSSKSLFSEIEKINLDNNNPKISVLPLPKNAQFLNVIESIFSGLAKSILHNSNYKSLDECKKAIDTYFKERNKHYKMNPKRAGQKIWGKENTKPEFKESNVCKNPRWENRWYKLQ